MSVRLRKPSVTRGADDATEEQLSSLITQVTNEINWHMSQRKLTRADLASRMGISPGRISQVLSGGENLTLRTLASLAVALDGEFELELKPCKATEDVYAVSHSRDDAAAT
jgi:antitoxin component HigA of HigAB toxin-antitoxin module